MTGSPEDRERSDSSAWNQSSSAEPSRDQIPSKVLAEFVYCPRAGYIEWVESDFRENAYTLDGERVHQRVDRLAERRRKEADEPQPEGLVVERTHLWLSSESLGLTAMLDLVEIVGGTARPVEYRRHCHLDEHGRPPLQDRVQVCVQAMLLEEQGYDVCDGAVYYADVRKRIPVTLDEELRRTTLERAAALRSLAESGVPPAPLVDSPKCDGCSLVGLCLPDEINFLSNRQQTIHRRLVPALDEGQPLFVATPGTKLRRSHSVIKVTDRDKKVLMEAGISSVSQVGLFGNVQVTTQAMRALASEGVTITFMTGAGWLYGVFSGMTHKNIELRIQQFRAADHPHASLDLARAFVEAKILNSRTLLMRNAQPRPDSVIADLKSLAASAAKIPTMESLLGIEGTAARLYFSKFSTMLRYSSSVPDRPGESDLAHEQGSKAAEADVPAHATSSSPRSKELSFHFDQRNRRPPRDPVNAMLSYAYAMLLREILACVMGTGLDPYRGFYHQPKYGRPCLALDLMEEFRSIVADSVVITVVNNGVLRPSDFIQIGSACNMRERAKKKFIAAFSRRMDQQVTHPIFGYRVSYRRIIEVQTRLLARYLMGDIDEYVGFRTR